MRCRIVAMSWCPRGGMALGPNERVLVRFGPVPRLRPGLARGPSRLRPWDLRGCAPRAPRALPMRSAPSIAVAVDQPCELACYGGLTFTVGPVERRPGASAGSPASSDPLMSPPIFSTEARPARARLRFPAPQRASSCMLRLGASCGPAFFPQRSCRMLCRSTVPLWTGHLV